MLIMMFHVQLVWLTTVYIHQAETEVAVESGNVNVVNKMMVSGYDVKVSQNLTHLFVYAPIHVSNFPFICPSIHPFIH